MQKIRSKQSSQQSQSITLKGSTKTVTEFFEFGLSSILYQRNVYPADDFTMVKKYGLNLLRPAEESLQAYLKKITTQVSTWLNAGQVSRLVLAIISKESQETIERWQFDVSLEEGIAETLQPSPSADKENLSAVNPNAEISLKGRKVLTEADIRQQIQGIIKHICASNAFLPILEDKCTFNVLAYTSKNTAIPEVWQESDAKLIKTGSVEQVKLRSFSTNVHKVEACVAYRLGED